MADQTQMLPGTTYARPGAVVRDRRFRKRAETVLWLIIALILAFTFFFPLYFMISSSFKAETEVLATPIQLIPQDFQGLTNYQKAFDAVPLARFFMNSTFLSEVIDL